MNMSSLDQHITGNYGEGSVPPEFIKAEELPYLGMEREVVIDLAPQTSDQHIPATVTKAVIASGFVHVDTKELAFTVLIPVGENVYFTDPDEAGL